MRYTLGEASKATGKSKTTIQRAIAKGNISAEKDGNKYSIDPSELHRIFPIRNVDTVSRNNTCDTSIPQEDTLELRTQIKVLEAMLTREREVLDEVRADRDAWRQQATALLAAPQKLRRWWPWQKS